MNFETWQAYYQQIVAEFGFDSEKDHQAAQKLENISRAAVQRTTASRKIKMRLRRCTRPAWGIPQSNRIVHYHRKSADP